MFSTRFCARAKMLCTSLTVFALLAFAQLSYAQVSVTATAGTPGPTTYTTLKGAFDAVNAGTHQGAVTIQITATTTETATAQLNAGNVAPASYTSVYVKPASGATPTVSGAIASNPIIKLNGANNVTIDGSNNGSTSRNLTITNTSTTTPQVVVIGSVGTIPVTGDTLKNCIITNGAQSSSAVLLYSASSTAATSVAGYSNNITIRNNSFQKARMGVYMLGAIVPGNGTGVLVTENDAVSTGANALGLCALYAQGLDGVTISNNNVGNFNATTAESDRGIWLATGTSNATVSGNTISGLGYSGTGLYAPSGIGISTGNTNANISVANNTISNISSAGTDIAIGIYSYTAASGITIQKNKISNIKNTNTAGYGSAGILLAGTLTASNTTVANNFVWDVASYGFNGFTPDDNGNGIVIDDGGGYNIYHNTVALTTNQTLTAPASRAAAMLVTDFVTATNSINIRNNIFANFQTVGNANSRFAMVSTANNNVYASLDYNDYYSLSDNLTSKGNNASITNTIAQVQTSLGGNTASVEIQPAFASLTDLHLTTANTTLNNLGTPIAGITTDIDGDARSATAPDLGADEFLNCPPLVFTQPVADTACVGGGATFSVAAAGATAYQWQVNAGTGWSNLAASGVYAGVATTTLTITGATTAMSGYQYRAYATGPCSTDTSAAAALLVAPVPASPAISSNNPVCSGNTIQLNAQPVAGGTFAWSGPGSYSATGQTATRANATTAMSGSYTATVTVLGCTSAAASMTVTVNPTPQIATATGTNPTTCGGTNGSIVLGGLAASTVYLVTYTRNGTATGPVAFGSNSSGVLTVLNLNNGAYTNFTVTTAGCTSPVFTSTVNLVDPGAPAQPSAIAGSGTGCTGVAQTYSVTPVTGMTYAWTLPAGWSGSSSTASISATAGAAAQPGTISVTASNSCGTSIAQTLAVNVSSTPAQPGPITGAQNNCSGVAQLYSVVPVAGATGYTWTLPPGWTGTSNTSSISATPGTAGGNIAVAATNVCGSSAVSTLAISSGQTVSPSVSITPSTPTTICAGTPVTFTAVSVGGGASPQYHWLKNGMSTGNYTSTYSNSSLASGDVITLVMTSSSPCALPSATVASAPLTITVQPVTLTGININAGFATAPTVCVGTPVTFVANATGGGAAPTYQWQLNGAIVGTNAPTYTTSTLAPGDSVMCVLASSATCPTPASAISNKIGLTVVTSIAPQIAITASPDTTMVLGQPVTFTATTLVGEGFTPGYQWFKNGVGTGATGPSYTTTSWTTGDRFYVRMVSSLPCAAPGVVTSNVLRMTGTTSIAGVAAAAGLSLWPNPNTGRFTLALSNTAGNLRTRIEILNALGQVVYVREVIVDRTDWSTDIEMGAGIADGIYLLRLSGEDGTRSTARFEVRR